MAPVAGGARRARGRGTWSCRVRELPERARREQRGRRSPPRADRLERVKDVVVVDGAAVQGAFEGVRAAPARDIGDHEVVRAQAPAVRAAVGLEGGVEVAALGQRDSGLIDQPLGALQRPAAADASPCDAGQLQRDSLAPPRPSFAITPSKFATISLRYVVSSSRRKTARAIASGRA